MKKTQIGLSEEFPYEIRDNNVYCSTLCAFGKWERSPKEGDVKAFRTKKNADDYAIKKGFGIWNSVIPYKEWEKNNE